MMCSTKPACRDTIRIFRTLDFGGHTQTQVENGREFAMLHFTTEMYIYIHCVDRKSETELEMGFLQRWHYRLCYFVPLNGHMSNMSHINSKFTIPFKKQNNGKTSYIYLRDITRQWVSNIHKCPKYPTNNNCKKWIKKTEDTQEGWTKYGKRRTK